MPEWKAEAGAKTEIRNNGENEKPKNVLCVAAGHLSESPTLTGHEVVSHPGATLPRHGVGGPLYVSDRDAASDTGHSLGVWGGLVLPTDESLRDETPVGLKTEDVNNNGVTEEKSRKLLECVNILSEIRAQQQVNSVAMQPPELHGKWERVVTTVDSGAMAPVMPPSIAQAYPVQESSASRAGNAYLSASGGVIPNLGEKVVPVITKEGTIRGYASQCADVTTALSSVVHMNRTGHGVWLDGEQSFMVNEHTGEVNAIDFDGKKFTMEMWVVPPDELHNIVQPGNHEDFRRPHP